MNADPSRPDRAPDREGDRTIGAVRDLAPPRWLTPDLDDEIERASWQDWQRTFNGRILANLFRRTAEGT